MTGHAGRGYLGGGLLGLGGFDPVGDAKRQAADLSRGVGRRVQAAVRQGLPGAGRADVPGPGPRGRAAPTFDGCPIYTHPLLGRYSPACSLAHVGNARIETGGRFSLLEKKVRQASSTWMLTMGGVSFYREWYDMKRRNVDLSERQMGRIRDPEWKDGWRSDVTWNDDPKKPPFVISVEGVIIPIGPRMSAEAARDAVTWWPGTNIDYGSMGDGGHPLEAPEAQVRGVSEAIARRHVAAGLRGDALITAVRQDQIALAWRLAGGDMAVAVQIAGHPMRPGRDIWKGSVPCWRTAARASVRRPASSTASWWSAGSRRRRRPCAAPLATSGRRSASGRRACRNDFRGCGIFEEEVRRDA